MPIDQKKGGPFDPTNGNINRQGQPPCSISGTTAPDFNPVAQAGITLTVTGMLKEIYGDPVLVITDAADILPAAAGPKH